MENFKLTKRLKMKTVLLTKEKTKLYIKDSNCTI